MNRYLLDTHYWLWFQMGNSSEIDRSGREFLFESQREGLLCLSAVSVWEVARLVADGHLDLQTTVDDFLADATRDGSLELIPLSIPVLIASTRLPGQIHRDPADRLLVATAREHGMTLVTRDKGLLTYGKHGHVRVRKI